MKVKWIITRTDVAKVKALVESQAEHPFVRARIRENVDTSHVPAFSRARFWKWHIACMLSSRQPSGPDGALNRLLRRKPFPLTLRACRERSASLVSDVARILSAAGGIRFIPRRSQWVADNLAWLEEGGWDDMRSASRALRECRASAPHPQHSAIERCAAKTATAMKGFGPKQSRNLWQALGLSRYEIPVDARVTRWLNGNVLDLKLSAGSLGDWRYYEFVLDGLQQLCAKAEVLPCVFDAAAFSLGDPEWSASALIW